MDSRGAAPPQALEWRAVEWSDGALYEGLSHGTSCHRQGVLHFANSDRYEGEFVNNRMQGYGVYIWKDGTIYRGEWQYGMMHGCGVQLRRGPDGELAAMEGKFFADEFVGPVMSCGAASAQEAAVEADVAAALARALQTPPGARRRQANTGRQGKGRTWGAQQQQQQQQQQVSGAVSDGGPVGGAAQRSAGAAGAAEVQAPPSSSTTGVRNDAHSASSGGSMAATSVPAATAGHSDASGAAAWGAPWMPGARASASAGPQVSKQPGTQQRPGEQGKAMQNSPGQGQAVNTTKALPWQFRWPWGAPPQA